MGHPLQRNLAREVDFRMATNVTRSQATNAGAAAQTALAKDSAARRTAPETGEVPKAAGYGLPCAQCHLYYPANLDACPTCKHKERVSPVVPKFAARPVESELEKTPDTAMLEREREEFLRQFKSQLMEAHAQVAEAPMAICKFGEHHPGEPGLAEVCTSCYERLQERLDVCEASLHIDLKEAAQIIYDAVWADPSDPSKTYQNAASAILGELRKRAGITTVLGPFQPLKH